MMLIAHTSAFCTPFLIILCFNVSTNIISILFVECAVLKKTVATERQYAYGCIKDATRYCWTLMTTGANFEYTLVLVSSSGNCKGVYMMDLEVLQISVLQLLTCLFHNRINSHKVCQRYKFIYECMYGLDLKYDRLMLYNSQK